VFYPFTNAPLHNVYNWDYSIKDDILIHDYCKHGYWSFHHPIEHPDDSGEGIRVQLAHETRRHNDDNYHDYSPQPFDAANKRIWIGSRYRVEYLSYKSVGCDQQPDMLHQTRRIATMMTIFFSTGFDPTNKKNRIPFPQVNGVRSSVREPTINYIILTLNRQYQQPKANWRDDCESAHPVYLQL
jgi:hypothetical protein